MCKIFAYNYYSKLLVKFLVSGMYLYLHVRIYVSNNSYIDIDEIGERDDGALLCVIDLVQCCHTGVDTLGDTVLGRWIYPNITDVPIMGAGSDFYHNRGPSVVRLLKSQKQHQISNWTLLL